MGWPEAKPINGGVRGDVLIGFARAQSFVRQGLQQITTGKGELHPGNTFSERARAPEFFSRPAIF
jgi:hypothetical protein